MPTANSCKVLLRYARGHPVLALLHSILCTMNLGGTRLPGSLVCGELQSSCAAQASYHRRGRLSPPPPPQLSLTAIVGTAGCRNTNILKLPLQQTLKKSAQFIYGSRLIPITSLAELLMSLSHQPPTTLRYARLHRGLGPPTFPPRHTRSEHDLH